MFVQNCEGKLHLNLLTQVTAPGLSLGQTKSKSKAKNRHGPRDNVCHSACTCECVCVCVCACVEFRVIEFTQLYVFHSLIWLIVVCSILRVRTPGSSFKLEFPSSVVQWILVVWSAQISLLWLFHPCPPTNAAPLPAPPLTKERSSVGRAQAPHRFASGWLHP